MKYRLRSFLPLLVVLLLPACDAADTDGPEPMACTLSIPATALPSLFSTEPFQVTYRAARTGEATLASLTYLDADGTPQTVANPALPWTTTLTVAAEGSVALSGQGTVTDGSLTITVEADNGDGATLDLQDDCRQTVD